MLRSFTRVALAAVATLGVATANARADLTIQVSSFTAGGGLLGTSTSVTVPFSTGMPPTGSALVTSLPGGFTVIITSNIATSPTGAGGTSHSLSVNISYSGPTGVGLSNQLLVQFLGTNYTAPTGPSAITSNASTASGGTLFANSVTMTSTVSTTNAGFAAPTIPASLPGGAVGTTTGTGMVDGSASVLTPDPSTGASFTLGGTFSFQQSFVYSGFTTTGTTTLAAGSIVNSVPEPATMVGALIGIGGLGLARMRRRTPVMLV